MKRSLAAVGIVALIAAGLTWRWAATQPPSALSPAPPGSPFASVMPTFPPSSDPDGPNSFVLSWGGGLAGAVTTRSGMQVTGDGGKSWHSAGDGTPESVDFVDEDFVYGAKVSLGTDWRDLVEMDISLDGARTWRTFRVAALPVTAANDWHAWGHFTDREHGVTLATLLDNKTSAPLDCRAFVTDDGGASWSAGGRAPCVSESPRAASVSWSSPLAGWVVPLVGQTSEGYEAEGIWFTADGGRTWQTGNLPGVPSGQMVSVQLIVRDGPEEMRLVVTWLLPGGSRGDPPTAVYRSTDGGASWTEDYRIAIPSGVVRGFYGESLVSFTALGPQHWRAVAGVSRAGEGELLETRDGGRSWSILPTAATVYSIDVVWWDDTHGMLGGAAIDCTDPSIRCGGSISVYLTDDAGRTWHRIPY